MKKNYKLSLFIFRRDLRLIDNTALIEALKQSQEVLCCFIFDPCQTGPKNSYKSNNCLQFMIESLQDLDKEFKNHYGQLYTLYGATEEIVRILLKELPFEALFLNYDYTPFSKKRDTALENICKENKCAFHVYHDSLLLSPHDFFNKQNKPYTVFTPFYKTALVQTIKKPDNNLYKNFYTKKLSNTINDHTITLSDELTAQGVILKEQNSNLYVSGGRSESKKIIDQISVFKNYQNTRDIPARKTTGLSAYNKFGTHSIREIYHAIADNFGITSSLIRELYWRDFFTHIAYHFPHVFDGPFHEKYTNLAWDYDQDIFKQWCTGTTGFPIVDAGMRQLNTTGFMHNRVRMIVGSFLTKDLHHNWQQGERYFAQNLVDYDPCVNNGNWQWVASTGCDAQPYFRIFNPWLQQKRFDPDCTYIKEWVPELRKYSAQEIHKHGTKQIKEYHAPIVNHTIEQRKALARYKKALADFKSDNSPHSF